MNRRGKLDPNATKALDDFKIEMGSELVRIDTLKENKSIGEHTGEYIPRKVIEEAERQLTNRK